MSTEARLDYLQKGGYRTGRTVKEDGSLINLGDHFFFEQQYNSTYQTVMNGAGILSRTCDVTTTDYYFGLTVPAGREFVLFSRILTLGEGAYEVDAVTCADGFSGGDIAYNTTLRAGAMPTINTSLYCGVTPLGDVVIRDQDYLDSGSGVGSARASASTERDGLLRIFGAGSTGLLRVTRLQAVNYKANIRMVCWERDAS